jgi:hypothetical protein
VVDFATFWFMRKEELDRWLQTIGLSDATRECCLAAGVMSRAAPIEEAVFFEFPVHAGGAESDLVELGFLCLTGLVITLHRGSISQLERIVEVTKPGDHRRKVTTSDLVAMILLSLSSQSVRLIKS